MIEVTQLNGQSLVINADLIESIEAAPHTIVTLTTRRKVLLKDSISNVVDAVVEYRQRIAHVAPESLATVRD